MPSTFVGLLIFLLLSAPGLLYTAITERGVQPYRALSVFRESVTISLISISADLTTLLTFAVACLLFPSWTPDIDRLVRDRQDYWYDDYGTLIGWAAALFSFACALAVLAARSTNRARARTWGGEGTPRSRSRVARWLVPENGADFDSGWWKMFFHPPKARTAKLVSCTLTDGTRVRGWMWAISHEASEGPDRDLLLAAPLTFQDAQGNVRTSPEGAVAISARNIVMTYVVYVDPAQKPD